MSTVSTTNAIRLVCLSAPEDKPACESLEKHLAAVDGGTIDVQSRFTISAGLPIDKELDAALDAADLIVLMISVDSLKTEELRIKKALVSSSRPFIPILYRSTNLTEELRNLILLPRDRRFISTLEHSEVEHAWTEVAREVLERMPSMPPAPEAEPEEVDSRPEVSMGADPELPRFGPWQSERIRLKHNWFDSLRINVPLVGPDARAPQAFLRWPEDSKRLIRWLEQAEAALSPAQILDLGEFLTWPTKLRREKKSWLEDAFRRSNQDLIRRIARCQELIQIVDREVTIWLREGAAALDASRQGRIDRGLHDIKKELDQIPSNVRWVEETPDRLVTLLVIDDLLGRPGVEGATGLAVSGPASLELAEARAAFCKRFRLLDAYAQNRGAEQGCIAKVVFCPGQRFDKERGFFNDLDVVRDALKRADYALVLVDLRFNTGQPDKHGIASDDGRLFGLEQVLPLLRGLDETPPTVVLTSESSPEVIEQVRLAGVEYLHRGESCDADLLYHVVKGGRATPEQLRAAMSVPDDMIAFDPEMLKVLLRAWQAARHSDGLPILIVGESGAGKEKLSRFIHDVSPRSKGPFRPVNCASYQPGIAEATLFGCYRGAFTGADADTPGDFQQAHGGTLVLDEFADLDEQVQPKLLRALEPVHGDEHQVKPVGHPQGHSKLLTAVDVRVVCCTSRPLETLRDDLCSRPRVRLRIPPLHERPLDIVPLALRFLREGGGRGLGLSSDARAFLLGLRIPGNARTLARMLDIARQGKGTHNILMRADLESAWATLGMNSESAYPPTAPVPVSPPKPAAPALDTLHGAVAEVLARRSSWDQMSNAQLDKLDQALLGRLMDVLAVLIEWALYRAKDVPAAVRYLTGESKKNRAPQDLVKRLLKLDRRIANSIDLELLEKKGASGKKMKELVIESQAEWENRQRSSPEVTTDSPDKRKDR